MPLNTHTNLKMFIEKTEQKGHIIIQNEIYRVASFFF